jgi:GT2 family glycosyltransferase
MINEIIEINTDNLEPMKADSDDLWYNRQQIYSEKQKIPGSVKVSIIVQAYNDIEKLRYTIDCILKYTPEELYELILIDNGSEPDVMELYKSVNHPRVQIIRITKNLRTVFPQHYYASEVNGEYTVLICADICVTKNWLVNLLACMESDKRIGLATPLSSNTQPHHSMNELNGKSMEEIQEFAARFNISNSHKWYQDVTIAVVIAILRSEIFYNTGIFDSAFAHQFGDDDFCMRIRRAGYKIIICKDTFVYHNHIRDISDDLKKQASAKSGFRIFIDKWNVKPWEDLIVGIPFHTQLTDSLKFINTKLLCIDPKLGRPILTISNHIKFLDGNVKKTCAFTSEVRFYDDLTTVTDETKVGQANNLRQFYSDNSFDIICLCAPLNTYSNPMQLLKDMTLLLKSKGVLLFHINNSFDIGTLLECFSISSSNFSVQTGINLSKKDCENILRDCGYSFVEKVSELMELDNEVDSFLTPIFEATFCSVGIPFDDKAINHVKIAKYHYTAVKD